MSEIMMSLVMSYNINYKLLLRGQKEAFLSKELSEADKEAFSELTEKAFFLLKNNEVLNLGIILKDKPKVEKDECVKKIKEAEELIEKTKNLLRQPVLERLKFAFDNIQDIIDEAKKNIS